MFEHLPEWRVHGDGDERAAVLTFGERRTAVLKAEKSQALKPVPQGRKYSRVQAAVEDHRLKPVPQVRIESTVGVFLGICVPQAHMDVKNIQNRLGDGLWS